MAHNAKSGHHGKTLRIASGCQYCAVGCGYNAILVPNDGQSQTEAELPAELDGLSAVSTSAMRNSVAFKGARYDAHFVPDARCDLNKGNHSVRGGSQGENLVSTRIGHRSTADRITSPMVRLNDGSLCEITWADLNAVMGSLVVASTDMKAEGNRIRVNNPNGLGVKLFEYQYLENTYAATKLFFSAVGTANVAYHDRPSAASSSPGLQDAGMRPHDFSYDEIRDADVLIIIGANPYENQSVMFMQYCQGKRIIVIDPRRTATAQYAAATGGLHINPSKLGADPYLLYSLAAEILRRWKDDENRALSDFPWAGRIATPADVRGLLEIDPATGWKIRSERKRQASRAHDLVSFADDFLGLKDKDPTFTLEKAAVVAGVSYEDLSTAVDWIFNPQGFDPNAQPKVGIIYEKGLIWGFNYHNTAAVGALGVLLGAYSEAGRFVGRAGGHQKGWAESKANLSELFANSPGMVTEAEASQGYPFRNSADRYSDSALAQRFPREPDINVHHNLDHHAFGWPSELRSSDQNDVAPNRTRLVNGLETPERPDVGLLWVIGGNYLGQTNDAGRKREALRRRLETGGGTPGISRPVTADPRAVKASLSRRIAAGGMVVVHQELFFNPTSELADIIIPAAGWGEDAFCRYNAQRRLKLYDRFQDSPLHEVDRVIGDTNVQRDKFLHSPKPDWMIFRDIAKAIGTEIDTRCADQGLTDFTGRVAQAFDWPNSAVLADEMAQLSHRGLAGADKTGRSTLGDLYLHGLNQQIAPETGVMHTMLGARDCPGNDDALAPYLTGEAPGQGGAGFYQIEGESAVYGNGIASNGVMLPIVGIGADGARVESGMNDAHNCLNAAKVRSRQAQIVRIEGTLRNSPSAERRLFLIAAEWAEIEPHFRRINFGDEECADDDGVVLTNGRFNHLWNNMFHHLRNDYVNERFPEDMPGTILELNPDWAATRGIRNGQVVQAGHASQSFLAIASLQRSAQPGHGFAMFSYPARNDGRFVFRGYVNNITDGYADAINPIAALKYGRATVRKIANPSNGAEDWIFPNDFAHRIPRAGPTFEDRSTIVRPRPFGGKKAVDWDERDRARWEMRELIVAKGLPRAFLRRSFKFSWTPHAVTNDPNGIPMTGRFWRDIPGLTPEAFLQLEINGGETVATDLLRRLRSNMPSGMLSPASLPYSAETAAEIDWVEAHLGNPGFGEEEFEEVKRILDRLLDYPHRAVADLMRQPDRFLDLLEENRTLRRRFLARLGDGPRRMEWKRDQRVIDEWTKQELAVVKRWRILLDSQGL